MFHFQILQCIKDSIACFIFIVFANMPLMYTNSKLLCIFFSLGAIIDCLFVLVRYHYELPFTVASIKDILGCLGMLMFTVFLLAKVHLFVGFWQLFFYLAFFIDYGSVMSVCFNPKWNIYTIVVSLC